MRERESESERENAGAILLLGECPGCACTNATSTQAHRQTRPGTGLPVCLGFEGTVPAHTHTNRMKESPTLSRE